MELNESERKQALVNASILAKRVRRKLSSGRLLVRIAGCLANDGHLDEYSSVLREVEAMSREMGQPDRGILMIDIGKCLAIKGDLADAEKRFAEVLTAVGKMGCLAESHGLLFYLAEAYCDLKWYDKAISLSENVTNKIHKNGILTAITRKCVGVANLSVALMAIQRMENPSVISSESVNIILGALEKQEVSDGEYQMIKQIQIGLNEK